MIPLSTRLVELTVKEFNDCLNSNLKGNLTETLVSVLKLDELLTYSDIMLLYKVTYMYLVHQVSTGKLTVDNRTKGICYFKQSEVKRFFKDKPLNKR